MHGNLVASNIVRIESYFGLIDFESANLFESTEDSSILGNKAAGVSQRIPSGILPPELIYQVDLSTSKEGLQRYNHYWKHILNDSIDFGILNPDDIHAISSFLESFQDEQNALKRSQGVFPGVTNEVDNVAWREKLSETLQDISVDDLPDSLAQCSTIEEFDHAWSRLKKNAKIWEMICPRISENGSHAYFVKHYNDIGDGVDHDELPYDLAPATRKIDIWAFGMLMFFLCSRKSLFHVTVDGQLYDFKVYEDLYKWNAETAEQRISASIKDPLAQDLLLKVLVPEDQRLPTMDIVLQHPFFGPSYSVEAQNIVETYEERQLKKNNLKRIHERNVHNRHGKQPFSMEKFCKIVFKRLEDILFPTSLIVLPYQLQLNLKTNELEMASNQESLSFGEKIGDQLIKLNTVIAKLIFWLKMKENLSEQGGSNFKKKIIAWIRRARAEGSQSIAQEIVASIGFDKRFEGICREMLDEAMDVSRAGEFIKDPMKAASNLMGAIVQTLMQCYPTHILYLIDEFHGKPAFPISVDDLRDKSSCSIYMQINKEDFEETLMPFLVMTMMLVTHTDGLVGLARILGFPNSYRIPKSWDSSNVDFLPHFNVNTSAQSGPVQFATYYNFLRQGRNMTPQPSGTMGANVENDPLSLLEVFFTINDSPGHYADLFRTFDQNATNLTFWTTEAALENKEEFSQALIRLEQLQEEIEDKKKLEEEAIILNERIAELKSVKDDRIRRKNQKRELRRAARAALAQNSVTGTRTTRAIGLERTQQILTNRSNIPPQQPNIENNSQQVHPTAQTLAPNISLRNNINEMSTRWNADQAQPLNEGNLVHSDQFIQQQVPTNTTPFNTPNNVHEMENESASAKKKAAIFFI